MHVEVGFVLVIVVAVGSKLTLVGACLGRAGVRYGHLSVRLSWCLSGYCGS